MNSLLNTPKRWFNLAGFLICTALLGYAYYVQFHLELEPCPLCIFQRVAFIALGIIFLLAATYNPSRLTTRIYSGLLGFAALTGGAIAGRHVWLQHLPPDQVPDCGPGLGYMLDVFPLSKTLKTVFTGSGECAEVSWNFLGLSMPTWTLFCFIGIGVLAVWRNWQSR